MMYEIKNSQSACTPHSALRTSHSKGTATVEFVMAIPLLAMVIAGTFFFGWVMRNHQRMRVADRYAAWRGVYDATPSANTLDVEFFDGRGEEMAVNTDTGPDGTLEAFMAVADAQSEDTGALVEVLVTRGLVPRGQGVRVESDFATSVALWRKLAEGSMETRHVREGLDWQRGQVRIGAAMRELYFDDLDQAVNDIAGTSIGQSLQRLYERGW